MSWVVQARRVARRRRASEARSAAGRSFSRVEGSRCRRRRGGLLAGGARPDGRIRFPPFPGGEAAAVCDGIAQHGLLAVGPEWGAHFWHLGQKWVPVSCEGDLFDWSSADGAGIAAVAVYLVLDLEVSAHAFRIDVIGYGGAAELDGATQDFVQGGAQKSQFGAGEAAGLARGTDGGAEERLVCVDITDAVEQGLIEQRGLDRRSSRVKEGDEVWERDGEWFGGRDRSRKKL